MKRSLYQARNQRQLATFLSTVLSMLVLAIYPNSISAQETAHGGRFETKIQKITRATFKITNRCPEPHHFRVTSNIKDPRFKQQTDAILIGAASTEKIKVLFDASGSKTKAKATLECLDCKKEEGCRHNRAELILQMTAVEPPPVKKGEVPSVSTRFSSGLSPQGGANFVGVIPQSSTGCPVGSEHIYISMDDEDDNNISSVNGWTGDISHYSTGTTFGFCKVDGNQFGGHPFGDYAVLKLSDSCPAGSVSFSRTFDNEHNANHNWSSGSITPNKSTSATLMYFCFFPSTWTMASFPNLNVPYGVFAAPSSAWLSTGTVFTDDEGGPNNDNTAWDGIVDANRFARIIYGTDNPLLGRNTYLLVAKVANNVANNTNCIDPCPFIGSYDGAKCWVGQPHPERLRLSGRSYPSLVFNETSTGYRLLVARLGMMGHRAYGGQYH